MPSSPLFMLFDQYVRTAARALDISIHTIPMTTVAGVSEAFLVADRANVQAVLVEVSPINARLSAHIISECLVRDLPSIHPWAFEVQAGALMSYGPATLENHAGAARYVDRILKGTKVSELPFEEPTEIKLAINLRTARSMKITVPQTLLARADEVIE
jgi:putative ABC transport system substrate-binding protein